MKSSVRDVQEELIRETFNKMCEGIRLYILQEDFGRVSFRVKIRPDGVFHLAIELYEDFEEAHENAQAVCDSIENRLGKDFMVGISSSGVEIDYIGKGINRP